MFRFPNQSHVCFSGTSIRTPIPRDAITVGDLEEAGPRVPKEAVMRTMENDTSVVALRKLGKTDTHGSKEGSASSIGTTIGSSIAARARQEFGYGDKAVHGVEGTTELELTIQASVERAVNDSAFAEAWREHVNTEELEIAFQPHMAYHYGRSEHTCPAQQVTTLKGPLVYGVKIEFHGQSWWGWQSMRGMLANMKGIHLDSEPFADLGMYKKFPILPEHNHPLAQTVHSTIENVLKFDHSTNVHTRITESAIDPAQRVNDAIKLLTQQYPGNSELGNALAQLVV